MALTSVGSPGDCRNVILVNETLLSVKVEDCSRVSKVLTF